MTSQDSELENPVTSQDSELENPATSQDSELENLDQNNKNLGGRPRAPIWSFFIVGEEIDSGHRSVTCECSTFWKRGRPSALECHILVDCKKVKPQVREAVRNMIEAREKALTKTTRKRKATEDQQNLDNYFENLALSNEQKTSIDIALIKLFVCGGLSWCLVEYPFFVEFVQQLRPAYCPPTRRTLANTSLDNEVLRVYTKIYNMLDREKNLTLG
ncbi:11876_t:CDS:1, partial [Cetraspora pellucida]